MYQDYYGICAERTAAFHTCGGGGDYFDQVSVLKIPKENEGGEGISDDLNWVTEERVYEIYMNGMTQKLGESGNMPIRQLLRTCETPKRGGSRNLESILNLLHI